MQIVVFFNFPVRIPTFLKIAATGKNLHEPHAAFNQPPSHQTLPAHVIGMLLANPVKLARRL